MRYFYVALFTLIGASLYAQEKRQLIPKIDRSSVRHRVWLDLSNGPSPTNGDFFLAGPGISVAWITKKQHLMKVKAAVHASPELFVNFPQQTWELNIMTGAIWPHKKNTLEFHYGFGVIGGLLHGKRIETYSQGFVFDFTADYEKVSFITIGIPLEFRVQHKALGVGVDANLNVRMPYAGLKIFTRIGLKK